ncbi:hypothetical protein Landi51_13911, partial [Colletotrichum acutatum]
IDNRLYERRLERKGQNAWNNRTKPNVGRKYRPTTTATGYHSGPMDLSVAKKEQTRQKKDFKCYNCDRPGHMARDCRQPKRIQHQPVPEKRANIASKEIPHGQLSWTACYDDNCLAHQDSKEQTGWYPRAPPRTKTLAMTQKQDTTQQPSTLEDRNKKCIQTLSMAYEAVRAQPNDFPKRAQTLAVVGGRLQQRMAARGEKDLLQLENEIPAQEVQIPTKSICMMRREDGDKKFIRKVKEQLQDLSREDRIEVLKRPTLDFEVTNEGRIDFRIKENEIEIGTSSYHFNEEESPYDSDEPRDVARRRAQMEIDHKAPPSVDDTSSEEGDDEPRCKNIHPFRDDQVVQFYGTGERKKIVMTPHTDKDHSLLDPEDPFHKELFWAECLDDKCLWHLAPKQDSHFYPRRHDNKPIKDT